MRWLTAPDLFEEPSPEILDIAGLVLEAKWAGIPVWDLAQKPEYWRSLIRLGQEVERKLLKIPNKSNKG